MVNYTLVIFMIITIVLLFTIMVFSAMSGSEIVKTSCSTDEEAKKAHKNSTIAAIVAGVAVVLVLATLIIYIVVSRKQVALDAAEKLRAAHEALAAYGANPPLGADATADDWAPGPLGSGIATAPASLR